MTHNYLVGIGYGERLSFSGGFCHLEDRLIFSDFAFFPEDLEDIFYSFNNYVEFRPAGQACVMDRNRSYSKAIIHTL